MKKISVLIPAYNAASFIETAIKSALDQTYPASEIIVVDDESTDETESILKDRKDIRYVRCEHQGISASRNRCISEAAGEWIAFLDADDIMDPHMLEKEIEYIGEHPDCRIVFCRYENFSDIPDEQLTERQRVVKNALPDHRLTAALIHKSVFERYGGFVTSREHGEDTEWIMRLEFAGMDLSDQIEDVLYFRRIHDSNITLEHEKPDQNAMLSLKAEAFRNARKALKGNL